MLVKRLLFVGALVSLTVALSLPHRGGDRTVFTLSGGGLKHAVSFDSNRIGPARGWWWQAESRVPQLTGPQLRMRFYDSEFPSVVTEWMYLPQSSGALSVIGDGVHRGERTVWMAFTPAFNADLTAQLNRPFYPVDSHALLVLLAIGAVVLLLMTAAGFRFYAAPLWLLHLVKHDAGVAIAADSGPTYLYTSVPRALWPSMGLLGRPPTGRAKPD